MKPKILITQRVTEEVERFLASHCEIRKWEGKGSIPDDLLTKELQEVEGIYTTAVQIEQVNEQLLKKAPHLKVISNVSVGYNNFDVKAMKKHNVIGTHTPNVLNETVADLAFGLILSTARRIVELDGFMKAGKWTEDTAYADLWGKEVNGETLGIIGMGRIGEAIAKRAKFGFDMEILYHNRSRKPQAEEKYEAKHCTLEELLEASDYVLLMTPLTKETYHLIGEREFKMMKDSAILINVSRGQTVDEKALVDALRNKEIQAAGLDVFEEEPPHPNNPLFTLPNVVAVPHIGSATPQTEQKMSMCAAENLVAVLTGNKPENPVWE